MSELKLPGFWNGVAVLAAVVASIVAVLSYVQPSPVVISSMPQVQVHIVEPPKTENILRGVAPDKLATSKAPTKPQAQILDQPAHGASASPLFNRTPTPSEVREQQPVKPREKKLEFTEQPTGEP
jgi:hypothetical protein